MRLKSAVQTEPVNHEARNQLVMQHVAIVKTMAQRLMQRLPSQVDVDDLMSAGVVGLIDAAGRYKASTGVPFDAFARRRVHGAMLDALRDLDWAPRSLRRLRRDLDSTLATLRHSLGREPQEAEVAAAMNLSPDAFAEALEQLRTLDLGQIRPLDATTPDGGSLLEFCVDPGEGVMSQLERSELRAHLARAINQLPDRERHIIALYYDEELTLAEIGAVIGVGESRVCQLRALAISRLRASLQASLQLQEIAS